MAKFEDVEISSLTAPMIDSLKGRKENQRLEFKETIDGVPNYEVAKDIDAMTNGGGGYFVIGPIEDSQGKQCSGFRPVPNPNSVCTRLKDIALQYIKPPLVLAPEVRKSSEGQDIVVALIPESTKPRAIEYDGTEWWKRYGTDKRQMPYAEIEKALTLATEPNSSAELEKQRQLAADPTRWNEITDRRVLWEVLDREFSSSAGERRYLRLTITPHELKESRVDVSDSDLRMSIWYPTDAGQREHGWNVRTGGWGLELISDPVGLKSSPLEKNGLRFPFIRLTRSGHLEFWAPVEPATFLPPSYFRSNMSEGFILWPTAVCEYPVSFLRFAKKLYERLKIPGDFTWRMQYSNLRGCILYPFIPGRSVSFEPPRTYSQLHFEPREAVLVGNEWDPDRSAFELIKKLYEAFGLSAKHVPLFLDGKFEPDRWQC
jgi:Putative DNA-binding domain